MLPKNIFVTHWGGDTYKSQPGVINDKKSFGKLKSDLLETKIPIHSVSQYENYCLLVQSWHCSSKGVSDPNGKLKLIRW